MSIVSFLRNPSGKHTYEALHRVVFTMVEFGEDGLGQIRALIRDNLPNNLSDVARQKVNDVFMYALKKYRATIDFDSQPCDFVVGNMS